MALYLIAMFINTTKVIGPAMDIKHDSCTLPTRLLSRIIVCGHLYPLSPQRLRCSSPLPPFRPTDLFNSPGAQLRNESICCRRGIFLGYRNTLYLYPYRRRDPWRREVLDFFNGMVRSVVEKLAGEMETLVVGYMRRWLLLELLAIEVLYDSQIRYTK